ncbi:MAG: arginyl-tRNA--protein transferase [Desulfomonile sp.]|nr:arginyl-tRNA--protein transferase [Desulfomonile sp.]
MAVSIADIGESYLSSVYVFFDPAFSSRSLGTFSAIHEMRVCAERSIPYYYLGYYVAGSKSMRYKARFTPHEILSPDGGWLERRGTR